MASLSYVTVTSAKTPMYPDPPQQTTSQQPTRLTKILLPRKEPLKWSIGVAPGDYVGPPTTSKRRKYWGCEDEDFVGRFKLMIGDAADVDFLALTSPVKEEPSGFLSLNRVMTLDSLDVDLSKVLTKSTTTTPPEPITSSAEKKAGTSPKWRPVLTRREQEKWERVTKAATGGSLKKKLKILTFGIGGIGLVSAYVSYSPEIAARGSIGQPRLLVHVVLVMIYNRWNGLRT